MVGRLGSDMARCVSTDFGVCRRRGESTAAT